MRTESIARTDRWAPFYYRVFDYGRKGEKLRGKSVLDVGAGDSSFAEKTRRSAWVVRVDPGYIKLPPPNPQEEVAAFGQELPFRDGAFDITNCSALTWRMHHYDLQPLISEMIRVSNPLGGQVNIYPVFSQGRIEEDGVFEAVTTRNRLRYFSTLSIRLHQDSCGQSDAIAGLVARSFEFAVTRDNEANSRLRQLIFNATFPRPSRSAAFR